MSIVIAVCTHNYGLIMSDGRMSKMDAKTKTVVSCNENLQKYRVMNENVCIGFAGEAISSFRIVNSLPDDKIYNIDEYANMILNNVEQLDTTYLPVHFIILGLNSENKMATITISSKNNFKLDKECIEKPKEWICKVAFPFLDSNLQLESMKKIENVVQCSQNTEALKSGLISEIINISKMDITVNTKIKGTEIFKRSDNSEI